VTIQFANAIVQRLGPCSIALDRNAHAELTRELSLLGCTVLDAPSPKTARRPNSATAGFIAWLDTPPDRRFTEALRPFGSMDALVLQSGGQERRSFENRLFEAGWQRHPGGMMSGEYPAWSGAALPSISYYQRAAGRGAKLLRAGGVEADAAIARYGMAAQHVRPGDHLLVDGPDGMDGASILASLSRAGSISAVAADCSRPRVGADQAVDRIETSLAEVADHSIDMVVAFEPSMPADWVARLHDYARVLKFDGRLVIGWRQTGRNRTRPCDWAALDEVASDHFLPELRYVQVPIGGGADGPHALFTIDKDQAVTTEWLIMVASVNPLLGEGHAASYDHPAFRAGSGDRPALVDFGAAYDNPYLYRSMVQMGERLGDELKLARLAECVIEDSPAASADRGAAIAVLGYRVLELRLTHLADQILSLISAYRQTPLDAGASVHVRRWRISLAFLAGRLCELGGDGAAARRWYGQAAGDDWALFSPLLATKSIAASFYEARICLAEGDREAALACFRQGVETAVRAAACPHAEQMAIGEKPLPFYLTELAEVIDMGSQCANAVAHFDLWRRDPGLFWRQVDIRRFGLASWARDLEQENQRLRAV